MPLVLLAGLLLCGCSAKELPVEIPSKYPETPTMQSAEDAMKGKL